MGFTVIWWVTWDIPRERHCSIVAAIATLTTGLHRIWWYDFVLVWLGATPTMEPLVTVGDYGRCGEEGEYMDLSIKGHYCVMACD